MLRPEFSEFTFGYAFTENFANGWIGGGVRSVPIFPSLIQEGRLGGGYDVAIPTHAEPILFQFKVPQIVRRRSRFLPPRFTTPYYRMHLEPGAKSTQHRALLQHARRGRRVYYVSPCFDRLDHLDNHYRSHSVPGQCVYFKPDEIGVLDDQAHFISFKTATGDAWLFSDPKEATSLDGGRVREEVRAVARRARPTIQREQYYAELSRELVQSIEESVDLPVDYIPVERKRDASNYIYDELRKVQPRELLALARSTEAVSDPLERYVILATFMLDCHVVLVGPQE